MWRREAQVSWLNLKTKGDGLWVVWHQNHSDGFLWFGLKTGGSGFSVWTLKPAGAVWWFESQNHRDGFLLLASKPSWLCFVSCTTKLIEGGQRGTRIEIWYLLRLEASHGRVFSLVLRLTEA
jgi:hypothetical protein